LYFSVMNRYLYKIMGLSTLIATVALSACSSSGGGGVGNSVQPALAKWRCTGGVTMTVRREGANLLVSDSRGVETELPADPPGQRERYSKTGYALVFEGRNASWFASGKAPTDCQR